MPLRAYINGKEFISIDLPDDEWNNLKTELKSKKSVLILPWLRTRGVSANKLQRVKAFRSLQIRLSL